MIDCKNSKKFCFNGREPEPSTLLYRLQRGATEAQIWVYFLCAPGVWAPFLASFKCTTRTKPLGLRGANHRAHAWSVVVGPYINIVKSNGRVYVGLTRNMIMHAEKFHFFLCHIRQFCVQSCSFDLDCGVKSWRSLWSVDFQPCTKASRVPIWDRKWAPQNLDFSIQDYLAS